MARVLTFSQYFPHYHPRAGQPTHFVEGLWKNFVVDNQLPDIFMPYFEKYTKHKMNQGKIREVLLPHQVMAKGHTIRHGQRFKKGDMFSPRIWSGVPYRESQIGIGPDIEVVRTWEIGIVKGEWTMPKAQCTTILEMIANNDGLSLNDFLAWFPKPFYGQIICWNKDIEY